MRIALAIALLVFNTTAFAAPRVVMIDNKPAPTKSSAKGLGGSEIDDMAQEILQQEGSSPQKSLKPLLQPLAPAPSPLPQTNKVEPRQTIRLEILQIAPLVQGQPLNVKFRLKSLSKKGYCNLAYVLNFRLKY
jgi:hypothetical protein